MAVRKQHKRYSRPRKLFEKTRIKEENIILQKYGLKNKKEIWRADSYIGRIRGQAKDLIPQSAEKQQEFIQRLAKIGLIKAGEQLDDVLALTKEDILERRIQTIVLRKGLAKTAKEARQLITHRHIILGDRIITIPSQIVAIDEEKEVKLKEKKQKKIVEKMEQPAETLAEEKEIKEEIKNA